MAATEVSLLPQLLNEIASRITEEDESTLIELFSTTLDERYRNVPNLRGILDNLCRDNRINVGDTFLLEKCLGLVYKKAKINLLINEFKSKYTREIADLKEHESLLLRRDEIYDQVDKIMRNSHGLLLFGEAGVGKTFIAKDYLNIKHKGSFKEVNLREIKDSSILIVKILSCFGYIRSTENVDLKVLGSVLKCTKLKEKVILFLDNTDDFVDKENLLHETEAGNTEFSDIVETIIKSGNGLLKMLITSRNSSKTAKMNQILRSFEVGQLKTEFAIKMLKRLKMQQEPSNELLNKAVEICKFIPLNIDLFGGMLQNFGTVIDDVNHIVQTYAKDKFKELSAVKLSKKKEIEISTLSVLKANFDKLGDTVQQGASVLSLFCRPFRLEDVSFMFEGIMNEQRLNLILHALRHQRILNVNIEMTYDFHPSVRAYLDSRKNEPHIWPIYKQAKSKFLSRFQAKFKVIAARLQYDYESVIDSFEENFANFEFVFNMHITDHIPLFENYHDLQLASELLKVMFRKEWRIDFFQQIAKSSFDSGKILYGTLYLCQAAMSSSTSVPHKALQLLDEAMPHLQKLGADLSNDAPVRIELIAVESLYYEAKGSSLHTIGRNSRSLSDVTLALKSYENCYTMRKSIYGEKAVKADLARALSGLGACYCQHAALLRETGDTTSKKLIKQKFQMSIDCYKASLKMFEKVSPYSSEVPIVIQSMGASYLDFGYHKEAYRYLKKAVQSEKNLKIDGFSNTATIMFNIANACRELNKKEEAMVCAKKSFDIRIQLFQTHPDTVQSLYLLAAINHEQCFYVDAIDWYKQAFWMEEELADNNHSSVRKDIRKFMIQAFELAVKKGSTYLADQLEEWKACFLEMEKKEEKREEENLDDVSNNEAGVIDIEEKMKDISFMGLSSFEPILEDLQQKALHNTFDPGTLRMSVGTNGGRCEFNYLGVTLDIPQDSVDNIELEISCIPLSHTSIRQMPIDLEFGESIISDIIKIGPDRQSFKRPAKLSIPYSVCEVPFGRLIAMKFFDEESRIWETISVELSKDAAKAKTVAIAKVSKMTMYAVCFLHEAYSYVVPRKGVEFLPFAEKYDLKVQFDEGAFVGEDARVEFKLSTFSKPAIHYLELLGLKCTPVLHINVIDDVSLLKPVRIQLPMDDVIESRGKFIILRGDDGSFTEITHEKGFKHDGKCIVFEVDHFSNFVVAWVALLYEKVSKVTELLSIFSNVPFDVLFHVYGKKEQESQWIMCVACSQEHHSKRVNDFLTEDGHEKIERAHYNEGLFIGTKMKVSLRGSLYTTDDKIPLNYMHSIPCYTKLFRVEKDDSKCEKNYVIINGENCEEELTSIPIKLFESKQASTGISAEVGLPESDGETYPEHEPYRFFGLKLDNCGFQDVRLRVDDLIRLENLNGFPEECVQQIKSKVHGGEYIAAMKLTLRKIKESCAADKLTDTWFSDFFEKLEPARVQERLGKAVKFLKEPCRSMLKDSSTCSRFLEQICQSIYGNPDIRDILFKRLHLKPADLENMRRAFSDDIEYCRQLLERSLVAEESKINCLFDIVKALLETQRYFRGYGRNRENAGKIQILLDELGCYLEKVIF